MILQPEEETVIRLKYKAPVFSKLPETDLFTAAKILLLKLSVITGWVLPEGGMLTILIDQFSKKLTESYAKVNSEEVEYAFRQNTSVKDWGKQLNLSLVDEVMIPYLDKRLQLSRIEEQKKIPALPPPEVSDEEFLEAIKNLYLQTKDYRQIPELAYSVLIQTIGEPSLAEKLRVKGLVSEIIDKPSKATLKQYFVKLHFDNEQPG